MLLVVDPDIDRVRHLTVGLAGSHDVILVGSGREVLAVMQRRVPDLIVTEIDLPDASGIELIARIHTAPATRRVLLPVMSARGSVGDKIAAFQAGADDYLVKPVDARQLAEHVSLLSRFKQVIGGG